jgi:ribosomal-protein-alanine N-acetyltransferase
MQIEFENIILKPWILHNARELANVANNKSISDNLRDTFPHPYSYDDAINWLSGTIMINEPPRFFAIYSENRLVGSISLVLKEDIYKKNGEIGYFLDENLWGKGIITSAIKSVTSYGFNNFDLERIYAEPFADNIGSRRALEKAGFRCEAIFRKYVIKNGIIKDSCIYSVLKDEFKYL